jgi:molybdate transport system substrate-binding protein
MFHRLLVSILAFLATAAQAAEVQVAVAANFAAPMQRIAEDFARDTGHTARVSVGATGKFYAQIKNGAPFDVLLSADEATVTKLIDEHAADGSSRMTYAVGQLVLWSPRAGAVDDRGAVLQSAGFAHLACADPKLAPYGAAAVQVMKALDVYDRLSSKIVLGENIGQTFQFVASGSADLGFIARSQLGPEGKMLDGSFWTVPQDLYTPIRQDGVVLERGRANPAAAALLAFLRGEKAHAVIRSFGYGIADAAH